MVSVSQFVWLVVTLGAQKLPFSSAATCVEREDQVQGYLISSKPPFDNYYNISKAVYPSVDLPSLLIKITVRFLATADYILIHQNGTSRSLNVSNVSTTEADVLQTTGNETRTNDTSEFTWSASCLYVSGGDISMTAMNFFSLFAIWPNRRERHLHVSLPQFCKGYSSDTMIYFLSTVGIFYSIVAGSPSSKYEHRWASALLRNIQNIRICMGKKPVVSVTYENERISIKSSLPYLKCVLRLSCVVHGPIYCRFIGFLCKQFSLYIKVYQGWALQWSGSTDPPKKNGQKFAPAAPITSKFRLGNTR